MQYSSRAHLSIVTSATAFPIFAPSSVLHQATDREARLDSPSASEWSLSVFKRLLDLSFALVVLAIFGLPMLAIALCVRLTSPGPAFFAQQRVGREGRSFRIYKFRSMTFAAGQHGPSLTRDGDCRITGTGRWLRKLKLDELPQFYNVLRGEMSVVGPRPKLPQYTGIVNMPYRPGITGAATLAFRREEEILSRVHPSQLDPFYDRHIRPLKARIDARYMARATFWSDLRMIFATFLACMTPARSTAVIRHARTHILEFPAPPAPKNRAGESFETAN
jgi:lipopolysaccharide/colanic/teichoic acid biosynthesis glycosyltransferase